MSRLLYLSFLVLLGCPVEPKDIQDLNNDGPGKPGNAQGGQPGSKGPGGNGPGGNGPGGNGDGNGPGGSVNMGGTPPGAPNLSEMQATGPFIEGDDSTAPTPPTQEGDTVPGLPKGNMENGDNEGANPELVGTQPGEIPSTPGQPGQFENVNDEGENPIFANPHEEVAGEPGKQGEIPTPQDKHPTPDFEHQPGSIPATAGDVLPIYQQPPNFNDFSSDEQITITIEVSGATTFDYEFVVKREGDGRIYPKVIHKQADATSPVTVQAPATIDEPVWLVITADKTGDGPTPDDLVGGTESPLTFAGTDMSLSYSLQSDDSFMQNLPWFSQAQGGPDFER